ncbi:MAG: hypothetical protein ACRETN_07630 [Nevskiales bacterium]
MSALSSLLAAAPVVGFSGWRSAPPSLCAVAAAAARRVLALSPAAAMVVGCAAGVDLAVRSAVAAVAPARLSLFSVASGSFGAGRGAFARRSVAAVGAVAAAGGLWLSFPGRPCPAGLLPSASSAACFSGRGSGSWASLALAVGSGVPSLVFLGGACGCAAVPCPSGWGLAPVAGSPGWFCFVPTTPVPSVQRSLFAGGAQ